MGELLYETTHEHMNIQYKSRGNQHSGKWFLMKNFSSLWGLSKRFSTKISMVLVYINRAFMPLCYHYSYAKVIKILTLYQRNTAIQQNTTRSLYIANYADWKLKFKVCSRITHSGCYYFHLFLLLSVHMYTDNRFLSFSLPYMDREWKN